MTEAVNTSLTLEQASLEVERLAGQLLDILVRIPCLCPDDVYKRNNVDVYAGGMVASEFQRIGSSLLGLSDMLDAYRFSPEELLAWMPLPDDE